MRRGGVDILTGAVTPLFSLEQSRQICLLRLVVAFRPSPMSMASRAASSLLLLLLLLPCLLQLASISCLASPTGGRRGLLAYVPARKRAGIGGGRGADCLAMTSRKACLGRSEWCRWCRSDALDDMCFGSAEAWRLPRQIFSCEAPDA